MTGPQDSGPKLTENVAGALRPYPEYTDSDVPWLGRIPSHWDVDVLGRLGSIVGGATPSKDVPHFWDGDIPWFTPRDMKSLKVRDAKQHISKDAVTAARLKLLPPPAVLLVVRGMILARQVPVAVTRIPVTLNQDMKAILPVGRVNPTFLAYALSASQSGFFPLIDEAGHGTRRLPSERWRQLPVPMPPRGEQDAIVRLLDAMALQIDRLIGAKRRLIELLNEQKQAIIHRAVTRGLDPNVRFKPSGVEWLGNVPEHWAVAPLRRFAISRCDGPFGSGLKSSHYTTHGVRVVRLQNIGHSEFRDADAAYISPEHCASLGDHDVRRNDLLVAGLGDGLIPAGRACVAPDNVEPAMVKADCFRFRLRASLAVPQFIAFQLSATAAGASAILSTGATRQRINLQGALARAIAVPPLGEQEEIVSHLTSALRPLQSGVLRVGLEIELLGEYRTRLIAEVVTGKLDVRGVELPALDEAEPVDDASLEDEEASEADLDTATEDAVGSPEE